MYAKTAYDARDDCCARDEDKGHPDTLPEDPRVLPFEIETYAAHD
jgi:hypothetical protein